MISRIIKVSVSVISLGHKHHTLTLIFLDIAIPQVRESETILDSELQAVDFSPDNIHTLSRDKL